MKRIYQTRTLLQYFKIRETQKMARIQKRLVLSTHSDSLLKSFHKIWSVMFHLCTFSFLTWYHSKYLKTHLLKSSVSRLL